MADLSLKVLADLLSEPELIADDGLLYDLDSFVFDLLDVLKLVPVICLFIFGLLSDLLAALFSEYRSSRLLP